MGDLLDFVKFLVDFDVSNLSVAHTSFAAVMTVVIYFSVFLVRKFGKKCSITFNFMDCVVKCGIAFAIEFIFILLYGSRVIVLSIIIGLIASTYIRSKFFSFLDSEKVAERDLKMRVELTELNRKFKKSPYFSILEVLYYYGYISTMQKETVEAKNIFKSPDDMAKDFLSMPILTTNQLNEAMGIMNVIRREGKILTREEALMVIVNMNANVVVSDNGLRDAAPEDKEKEEQVKETVNKKEEGSEQG